MKQHYTTLGLEVGASQEQIKMAYNRLSKELNPANNDNQEFFKEEYEKVQAAYKALYNTSILATEQGAKILKGDHKNIEIEEPKNIYKYKKHIILFTTTALVLFFGIYKFILPMIDYNKGLSIMELSTPTTNDLIKATSYFEKVIEISRNYEKVDSLHMKSIERYIKKLNDSVTVEYHVSQNPAALFYWKLPWEGMRTKKNLKAKVFYILNKDSIPNYIDKKELYVALARIGPQFAPFGYNDTIHLDTLLTNNFYFKKLDLNKSKVSNISVKDVFDKIGKLDSLNIDYLWYKTGKNKLYKDSDGDRSYYNKIIKYYPCSNFDGTKKEQYNQIQNLFKLYDKFNYPVLANRNYEKELISMLYKIDSDRVKKDPWINYYLANEKYHIYYKCLFGCEKLDKKEAIDLYEKALDYKRREGFLDDFEDSLRIGQIYKTLGTLYSSQKQYTNGIVNFSNALEFYPIDFSEGNTSIWTYKNPRSKNINILSDLQYQIGLVKFNKNDWLGSIKAYEKALSYYEKDYATNKLKVSHILRNLFAAKWNYKKNGEKMDACDDLKLAGDLNPKEYYDYYIKNCAN